MPMEDKNIFEGVSFSIDTSIDLLRHSQLMDDLLKHGAKLWENDQTETSSHPTHIITERILQTCNSHLVLPEWVAAALRNEFTHDPKYYYPDVTKILTGVVVATSHIPPRDEISIFGATLALGGQCRDSLTKDVTHLVCIAPHGDAYKKATETMAGSVKVILPHWFDYCFKLARLVREDIFLFPDPSFLQLDMTLDSSNDNIIDTLPCPRPGPALYPIPTIEQVKSIEPVKRLFENTLIYVHSDVPIPANIYEPLKMKLTQSGAKLTTNHADTNDPNSTYRLTIFVFRYRESDLYMTTVKEGHMVVSLLWLTNTLYRGYFESPLRSLWDFPVPKCGIPGMNKMAVTITGYESGARSLIFHLCTLVGLRWTPNLESDTTLIICSKPGNEKYKVGRSRNCHIVNHLWLEECYQHWELKSFALDRYTCFPGYNILQNMVGKTPLLKTELERWNSKKTRPIVASYIPARFLCGILPNNESKKSLATTHNQPISNLAANDTDSGNEQHESESNANATDPVPDKTSRHHNDSDSDNGNAGTTELAPKTPTGKRKSSPVSGLRTKRPKLDNNGSSIEASSSSKPSSRNSSQEHAASQPPLHKKAPTSSNRKKRELKSLGVDTSTITAAVAHSSTGMDEDDGLVKKNENATPAETNESDAPTEMDIGDAPAEMDEDDALSDSAREELPSGTSTLTFVESPTAISTTAFVLTKAEEKSIKKLGSRIVPDITKADLLIVLDNDRVLRTPKFLCAVNLGITIVNKQWLTDSIKKETWCHPSEYQIHDREMEETYGFTLQASLLRAQQSIKHQLADNGDGKSRKGAHGTWLQGYEVCTLHAASGKALKEVVETAGGIMIQLPKRHALETKKKDRTKLLALTIKEDKNRNGWKDLQAQGFTIYDQELVIVGSICQELRLDLFRLG